MSASRVWPAGVVERTARKVWRCKGDGAAFSARRWACVPSGAAILAGDRCVEVQWEAAPYKSGTRHCIACALAFFAEPPAVPW